MWNDSNKAGGAVGNDHENGNAERKTEQNFCCLCDVGNTNARGVFFVCLLVVWGERINEQACFVGS